MSAEVTRARPLRVAVIGLGWAANHIWLPRLASHPAFELTAVIDPDPAARLNAADVVRVDAFADIGGLRASETDLAVVAVPNHLHAAVASPLLAQGLPVFVEKPVCLSAAEVTMLATAEREGGGVLLAGSAARYRSDIIALSKVVRSLGPIRHLELAWVRARGIPQQAGWFTDRRLAGGGALLDLGWHLLDVAFALLGSAGVRDVLGTVSADFLGDANWRANWRADASDREIGPTGNVEDTARAFLVTNDNVSVALRASWASHQTHDITKITVDGTAGTASLECTFGFSPNRVPHPTLMVVREGTIRQLPITEDLIGAEYGRQLDALPAMLAHPAARGQAIADAGRAVDVIERLYRMAGRPSSPAMLTAGREPAGADQPAGPVIAAADEVRELRSALAAAARGERFVLHALLPTPSDQPGSAWPRMLAAMRLVTLDAVALLYSSCRSLVTLLEFDHAGQLEPADRNRYMARLADLIRADRSAVRDEVVSAQQRMARLKLPRGQGSPSPAVIAQLSRAVAFMQAWGSDVETIGHFLRASTYLVGRPAELADIAALPTSAGLRLATCAHATTIDQAELSEEELASALITANPVLLRLPTAIRPDLLAGLADRLDRRREPGRLVISVGPTTPAQGAEMIAAALALRREGHVPAYVYRCSASDAGLEQLRLVINELATSQLRLAGVCLTIAGRHLEQAARIAQVLAEMTSPSTGIGEAIPISGAAERSVP
jgi:oxidoreductase